jgi:uncharacterized protein YceK
MLNIRHSTLIFIAASTLSGCATMLTSEEKHEYQSYQARGIAVEVKNPAVGAMLGILPGGGSFYARAYGWGVVNFLLWPFSVIWDPVSGYEGSLAINYFATQDAAPRMAKELGYLDDQLNVGLITKEQYVREKRLLKAKYTNN